MLDRHVQIGRIVGHQPQIVPSPCRDLTQVDPQRMSGRMGGQPPIRAPARLIQLRAAAVRRGPLQQFQNDVQPLPHVAEP